MDKQGETKNCRSRTDTHTVKCICASLCVGLFVCPFPVAASLCLLSERSDRRPTALTATEGRKGFYKRATDARGKYDGTARACARHLFVPLSLPCPASSLPCQSLGTKSRA
jgi:hypothetical protein